MNFLEERIVQDGVIKSDNVLKVDSFLNHQIDTALVDQIGAALYDYFRSKPISKILTIEASGIPVGYAVAKKFNVPLVCARKSESVNIDGGTYLAEVPSHTDGKMNQVYISKQVLNADDHVLIIDDLLANGNDIKGLCAIVEAADATVEGIGVAIEKGFQNGGQAIRNMGFDLKAIATIEAMNNKTEQITFRDDE